MSWRSRLPAQPCPAASPGSGRTFQIPCWASTGHTSPETHKHTRNYLESTRTRNEPKLCHNQTWNKTMGRIHTVTSDLVHVFQSRVRTRIETSSGFPSTQHSLAEVTLQMHTLASEHGNFYVIVAIFTVSHPHFWLRRSLAIQCNCKSANALAKST